MRNHYKNLGGKFELLGRIFRRCEDSLVMESKKYGNRAARKILVYIKGRIHFVLRYGIILKYCIKRRDQKSLQNLNITTYIT
jgi:hypothetical protein